MGFVFACFPRHSSRRQRSRRGVDLVVPHPPRRLLRRPLVSYWRHSCCRFSLEFFWVTASLWSSTSGTPSSPIRRVKCRCIRAEAINQPSSNSCYLPPSKFACCYNRVLWDTLAGSFPWVLSTFLLHFQPIPLEVMWWWWWWWLLLSMTSYNVVVIIDTILALNVQL